VFPHASGSKFMIPKYAEPNYPPVQIHLGLYEVDWTRLTLKTSKYKKTRNIYTKLALIRRSMS